MLPAYLLQWDGDPHVGYAERNVGAMFCRSAFPCKKILRLPLLTSGFDFQHEVSY